MPREISKDEFDEYVNCLINEMQKSPEIAVDEAVKQFEVKGATVSSLMKYVETEFVPSADIQSIEQSLIRLDDHLRGKGAKESAISELNFLSDMCKKSICHKVFVGKSNFVEIALAGLQTNVEDKDTLSMVLKGLISVTSDQPDVLNETDAHKIMSELLASENNEICLSNLLSWMKASCIINEENRQNIVEADCISLLKNILENFSEVPCLVKGVCSVFRALVLDDDHRVELGHHLEHAKKIAEAALVTLINLLKAYSANQEVVGEVVVTLSAVVVRDEFCEQLLKVSNGEALSHILAVFTNFPNSDKLHRQTMKLLKGLAGSERVRTEIVRAGAAPKIVSSMFRHQNSPMLMAFANACIAALTLRNGPNSKAFCDVDAPVAILEGMKIHYRAMNVQKQGCRAIRNMVSRCRDVCPIFLELGAEDLVNRVLREYYSQCGYDAKSALRDLGCPVEYLDEWFGGRGESCLK